MVQRKAVVREQVSNVVSPHAIHLGRLDRQGARWCEAGRHGGNDGSIEDNYLWVVGSMCMLVILNDNSLTGKFRRSTYMLVLLTGDADDNNSTGKLRQKDS